MENLGIIIALSASAFTIIAAMIAMMLWVRAEANADRRAIDADHKLVRRDLIDCVRAIELEMKDFHMRLCLIEERRKH